MSTRTYPLYRLGGPQLRIFLPNFWMKLVKSEYKKGTPTRVSFIVSSEMTENDVKNYLNLIYKVPTLHVSTSNHSGKVRQHPNPPKSKKPEDALGVYKEDDFKLAIVTLPDNYSFKFPDVVKAEEARAKIEEHKSELEEAAKVYRENIKKRNRDYGRTGLPNFFGL